MILPRDYRTPLSEGIQSVYKCLKGQSRQENLEVILNTLKILFYFLLRIICIVGPPYLWALDLQTQPILNQKSSEKFF